ncbi:hypothetical protein UPYG_G00023870 [Umbra pygmaea]|uniref:Uncharacterized protein n=1 Tax=Umbra pygmaea TaxID=75934 RepID=A0ABD0Y5E0_UMBPY
MLFFCNSMFSFCRIERLPHGGGRTGMFSPHQETLIIDLVRENNAIKLSEIQQKIIEDHVNFEGINSVSLSTVLLLIVSSSATDCA